MKANGVGIPHEVMRRAIRLLPMQYKPQEIADELHVPVLTLYRTWAAAGMPHTKDKRGAMWIVGTELRAWLEEQAARRRQAKKGPQA